MMWVAVVLLFSYLPLDDSRSLLLASWLAGSLALFMIAWSVSLKTKSSYLSGIWRPLALVSMALCEVTARLLVVQLRGRRVRATHVGGPIAFGTRT